MTRLIGRWPLSADPFTVEASGIRLFVRVTPRAKRTTFEGVMVDAEGKAWLAIKLNAPPVDGAANEALIAFLAKVLKTPKSSIALVNGDASRKKVLHIQAKDVTGVTEIVRAWVQERRPAKEAEPN